ncbi:hypothetical protein [uncultured Brevundimonas sp.]|uniref:hypothetical protein n=1 Tax=uncultured Brevundimonas sp. TaxID=213418 RepID=UPI0030EB97F2|tara:strand:+ start:618 stop:917 length:300 start_codon:yes stop_codon:yes gene_type:complete
MIRLVGITLGLATLMVSTTPAWGTSPPLRCRRVEEAVVVVACIVQADGTVAECEVVRETAPGCGYAEKALAGVAKARLRSNDTWQPGETIEFTMRFRNP